MRFVSKVRTQEATASKRARESSPWCLNRPTLLRARASPTSSSSQQVALSMAAASLPLGAENVVMGTRFFASKEVVLHS
jgi:hypothetical protein